MATQAISALGTQVRMGNGIPLAPIAIAGATVGFPLTLTTAVPHGVVDVTWVTVAGVGGTTTANGSWIAARLDPTHLWLRDAVGNAAYTGGGQSRLPIRLQW